MKKQNENITKHKIIISNITPEDSHLSNDTSFKNGKVALLLIYIIYNGFHSIWITGSSGLSQSVE